MAKYRIVTDNYAGYEVQIKRWWYPFWVQCWAGGDPVNTFGTLERAKGFIKYRKSLKKVIYQE